MESLPFDVNPEINIHCMYLYIGKLCYQKYCYVLLVKISDTYEVIADFSFKNTYRPIEILE